MSFLHSGALKPLSALVLGCALAPVAMAQIVPAGQMSTQVIGDTHEFSGLVRPAAEPARTGPLDEAKFTVLRQGGPWSVADVPSAPAPVRAVMSQARQDRWTEVLEAIKKDDVNPNAHDDDGATLLTLAARAGDLPVVQELLRRGADPDLRGASGFTPLGMAAMRGHDLVVMALLSADARVNLPSANGQPPLHLAARAGHVRVMRLLLKAHADPRAFNREGRHALSEAALGGQIPAMQVLTAAGVAPNTPDLYRLNALHAAALGRQFDAAAWLQQRGVAVTPPLTQVLLDRPADPPRATP